MSRTQLVDVRAPQSFGALEKKAPWNAGREADPDQDVDQTLGVRHFGAYLAGFLNWRIAAGETESGRRPFGDRFRPFRRYVANRTSTYEESFPSESQFGIWNDYTAAETPPDYSPSATVVFVHGGTGKTEIVSHIGGLQRRCERSVVRGDTSDFDELFHEVSHRGYFDSLARALEAVEAGTSTGLLDPPAVEETSTNTATVAELTQAMRQAIDLPVQDLAQMAGVGRRQFYNLMRGESEPDAERESRIRLVAQVIQELAHQLESPGAVRAAALTPLDDGQTLFEVARSGDPERLTGAVESLRQRIDERGLAPDVLPPSGRLPADDRAWEQAEEMVGSRGVQTSHADTEDRSG